MMSIWNIKEHSLSISLPNIKNSNILSRNTNRISILNNNNTLQKGGVGTLEAEDRSKEDLVKEETKSYIIIEGGHDIFPDIVKVL